MAETPEFLNGEWRYKDHTIEYDKTWGAKPWRVIGYVWVNDITYYETREQAAAFIDSRPSETK